MMRHSNILSDGFLVVILLGVTSILTDQNVLTTMMDKNTPITLDDGVDYKVDLDTQILARE